MSPTAVRMTSPGSSFRSWVIRSSQFIFPRVRGPYPPVVYRFVLIKGQRWRGWSFRKSGCQTCSKYGQDQTDGRMVSAETNRKSSFSSPSQPDHFAFSAGVFWVLPDMKPGRRVWPGRSASRAGGCGLASCELSKVLPALTGGSADSRPSRIEHHPLPVPSTSKVPSGFTHTAVSSSTPTPTRSGCSKNHRKQAVFPLPGDEVLVDDHPTKKPSPRTSSTELAWMTLKFPSPVIIRALWQAVPAEVPPTTAPRVKASVMALPTGVSSNALVMRTWSPPPKKFPRPWSPTRQNRAGRHHSGF